MTSQIAYSPVKDDRMHSKYGFEGDNGSEYMLLNEDNQKFLSLNRRYRRYLPWIFHGASILACVGILSYTLFVLNRPPESCIEKLNAYCELRCNIGKAVLINHQHPFFQASAKTTKM